MGISEVSVALCENGRGLASNQPSGDHIEAQAHKATCSEVADGKEAQAALGMETSTLSYTYKGATCEGVSEVSVALCKSGGVLASKQPSDTGMGTQAHKAILPEVASKEGQKGIENGGGCETGGSLETGCTVAHSEGMSLAALRQAVGPHLKALPLEANRALLLHAGPDETAFLQLAVGWLQERGWSIS